MPARSQARIAGGTKIKCQIKIVNYVYIITQYLKIKKRKGIILFL